MAIATEDSAALFTNIVASTPLNCNFPLYEADEVEVVYGSQALIAVYPTDYTVALSPPNFNTFTVTPTASLLTKINALIATPPTSEAETNFVVVRRKLDYLTSVEPETVRYTPFLSKEIDRIHMKLIQLAERVARNLGLPANVVGELTDNYTISAPVEGKAPVWRGNKLVAEIDAANIAAAQGYAEDAEDALAATLVVKGDTEDIYDDTVVVKGEAEAARDAALAAAAGMKWRPSVRAATTGALPACTYANGVGGVGATLTGNANGALAAQDGVTLAATQRVLIKDQASGLQNGVYVVTQIGTAGTPFILTRAVDADSWDELVSQAVIIEEGTTLADQAYICTVNQGGTIGTTAVTWASFNPPLVIASQAEAEAGVENTKVITSLRASQAIAAQRPKASQAEIEAETADKYIDAARMKFHPGVAKAWVKFNGTGTPAINASYNVSSITDVGVGDYLVNFTNNFSGSDYVMCGSGRFDGGSGTSNIIVNQKRGGTQSTSQCQVSTHNTTPATTDNDRVFCAFFGDQ